MEFEYINKSINCSKIEGNKVVLREIKSDKNFIFGNLLYKIEGKKKYIEYLKLTTEKSNMICQLLNYDNFQSFTLRLYVKPRNMISLDFRENNTIH